MSQELYLLLEQECYSNNQVHQLDGQKTTSGVNDRALRIVSGNVGDGGGDSFSSRFNSTVNTGNGSVQGHTKTTSQIPSHYHFAFRFR